MFTCYTIRKVPPFAQGVVRDLRVRWAFEEAGMPYRVEYVGEDIATEEYRALQPFGQVPTIRDGDFVLFESGAIVLHIAVTSGTLLPPPGDLHARAVAWMFAALNTVEPPVSDLVLADIFFVNEPWAKDARPGFLAALRRRLDAVAAELANKDYLAGDFTAADLLMATVLRSLRHTDMLESYPALAAYRARCEQRPAFRKALADQMASYAEIDA